MPHSLPRFVSAPEARPAGDLSVRESAGLASSSQSEHARNSAPVAIGNSLAAMRTNPMEPVEMYRTADDTLWEGGAIRGAIFGVLIELAGLAVAFLVCAAYWWLL